MATSPFHPRDLRRFLSRKVGKKTLRLPLRLKEGMLTVVVSRLQWDPPALLDGVTGRWIALGEVEEIEGRPFEKEALAAFARLSSRPCECRMLDPDDPDSRLWWSMGKSLMAFAGPLVPAPFPEDAGPRQERCSFACTRCGARFVERETKPPQAWDLLPTPPAARPPDPRPIRLDELELAVPALVALRDGSLHLLWGVRPEDATAFLRSADGTEQRVGLAALGPLSGRPVLLPRAASAAGG